MAQREDWLRAWEQLANRGDPDAQIIVAWEYAKGKIVQKDFDRAVTLFRSAESRKPRLARFNLAKAKVLNSDESFREDIREDCQAGYGPALYLMGVVELRGIFGDRNLEKAVAYFSRGARNNHLVSELFAWRFERKSVLRWLTTLPYTMCLLFKTMVIKIRDPDDLRVLT